MYSTERDSLGMSLNHALQAYEDTYLSPLLRTLVSFAFGKSHAPIFKKRKEKKKGQKKRSNYSEQII